MPYFARRARGLWVLPVALLGTSLCASCGASRDSDGPPSDATGVDASAGESSTVVESAEARAALDSLRARFATTTLGRAPKGSPTRAPMPRRVPAIGADVATGFVHGARGVRPIVPSPDRSSTERPALVTLPARASGTARVEDPARGAALAFALEQASDEPISVAGGLAIYSRGGPRGTTLVHRPIVGGTEDHVVFDVAPAAEELRYRFALEGVAGLRLVADTLEALDAEGDPILRVARPFVTDATGERRAAHLALEGCAADRDPRAPWDRPVTPPGGASCTLVVSWSGAAYPLVVDPTWSTTGSMTMARSNHHLVLLANGRVLAAGRQYATDLFNPATGSWAATGAMLTDRADFGVTKLTGGLVLAAGGWNAALGDLASSETYDASTGKWSAAGGLAGTRRGRWGLTWLADGGAVFVNSYSGERFDATTRAWSPLAVAPSCATAALTLGDGRVVGMCGGNLADVYTANLSSRATYTSGVWLSAPYLSANDGRVFSRSGVFNPSSGAWTAVAEPYRSDPIPEPAMAQTLDGRVVLSGGFVDNTYCCDQGCDPQDPENCWCVGSCGESHDLASAATLSPASLAWTQVANMGTARADHAAVALADGRVLVAGGSGLASSELLFSAAGTPCGSGTECATGQCVDGVCCNSACTGACMACSNAKTAQADGLCAPVKAGTDPNRSCGDSGYPTCGYNGLCNGAGACASYSGAGCTPGACIDNGDCVAGATCGALEGGSKVCCTSFVDGVCCDTPCTGTCLACTAAKKGQGADRACGFIKDGADPRDECGQMGSTTCSADGVCNGAGNCRSTLRDAVCTPASCQDAQTVINASRCNDSGVCTGYGTTSCAPYKCGAAGDGGVTSCFTSCVTASACVNGYVCAGGACIAPKANGASCASSVECQSSNCVEGVCCNSACSGPCQSCVAEKKGDGSADGSCGNVHADTDPKSACAASGNTCGADGLCDGLGACRAFAKQGKGCGAAACDASGTSVTGFVCDGAGVCATSGSAVACAPYKCSAGSCKQTCAANADCSGTNVCVGGACTTPLQLGQGCGAASECQSGFCVEGVCCDSVCDGSCVSCLSARKGGATGQCGSITKGTDPKNLCAAGATACGATGACNGLGSCQLTADAGSSCGAPTCTSNGLSVQTSSCDGTGTCAVATTTSCGAYGCRGGACLVVCATTADCAPGDYCQSGACVASKILGASCAGSGECASQHCVEGVCCDTACDGSCVSCVSANKARGSTGECGAIRADADPKDACAPATLVACGGDGLCDGNGACRPYAKAGTACGATTCTGPATVQGSVCDANGGCVAGSTSSCGAYACVLGACAAVCASDSDCAPGNYCDARICVAKRSAGQPCVGANACASGYCTEGVCCDSKCDGPCQSCLALHKSDGSASGGCGAVAADTDPKAACASSGTSCGADGLCDATGACRLHARAGTGCGAASCTANAAGVTGSVCDGAGLCTTSASVVGCAPYRCSAGGCLSSCAASTDCQTGWVCVGGSCVAPLSLGKACGAATECQSGFCVQGVCCDSGCDGACSSCLAQDKATGSTGECGAVRSDTDPKSACAASGDPCGADGLCDATGSCRAHARAGTGCGAATCTANGGGVTGLVCDGLGTCASSANVVSCAPYRCSGGSCLSGCATTADCQTGQVCVASSCVAPLAKGQACAASGQCQSGFCVEGVCCDSACDGACVSCLSAYKAAGSTGECGAIRADTDPKASCAAGGGACAADGLCDGAGACRANAKSGTSCGATTCSGPTTVQGSVCDGVGVCAAGSTSSCGTHACRGGACVGTCSSSADCAPGNYCDQGACLATKANGLACAANADCGSSYCVEGVCCDSACDGPCQSCRALYKADGSASGSCGAVRVDTDPKDACAPSADPCGADGLCDASGACRANARSGAACGAATCSANATSVSGRVCDGAGACTTSASSVACAPYRCAAGSCLGACATSSDCETGKVCVAGSCVPPLGKGQACSVPSECQSGFCSDGVCCDSACDGACVTCVAAYKATGSTGECGAVRADLDPKSACSPATTPCGADGSCDGNGACRAAARAGTSCGTTTCASTTSVQGAICDGSGACTGGATSSCGAYACKGTACVSTCSTALDCAPGHFCSAGACVVVKSDGAPCGAGAECTTGFCVDGVCCNELCDGACVSCNGSRKASGSSGTCGPVIKGTDPRDACPTGASACGEPGTCDGLGACQLHADPGIACGTPACSASSLVRSACDGQGTCAPSPSPCDPYACRAGVCLAGCTAHSDCSAGFRCEGGACLAKTTQGGACASDAECGTGHCADGVCCDSPCGTFPCAACNLPGTTGQCTAVHGQPLAPRSCAGTGTCRGSCDGTNVTSCSYPAQGTPCAAASCDGDSLVEAATCDGSGACAAGVKHDCGNYGCASGACRTTCATSSDCRAGAVCDTTKGAGVCNAVGTTCDGAFAVKDAEGTVTSCAGYACKAGACQSSCASASECDAAGGYACESGRCAKPAADAGAGGGAPDAASDDAGGAGGTGGGPPGGGDAGSSGGCHAAPGAPRADGRALLLVVATLALARRRRRATRGGRASA